MQVNLKIKTKEEKDFARNLVISEGWVILNITVFAENAIKLAEEKIGLKCKSSINYCHLKLKNKISSIEIGEEIILEKKVLIPVFEKMGLTKQAIKQVAGMVYEEVIEL